MLSTACWCAICFIWPQWSKLVVTRVTRVTYSHARSRHTVRSLVSEKSFLLTHCPQIYIRKEISRSGFLYVSLYSVVHSIDLRRVFLRYINISICKFRDSVSCLGLYGASGLYGQNIPYKFKNSYGDFCNRNFEKSYRTTGPRLDLRPDLWSWANSGLDSTFGNVETGSFWVTTRGA
jgi:hypothetical protein